MRKQRAINGMLFILIFLWILSVIILRPVNNLDELWNYNFARNIANGLVPYRDFNMVITPLLSIVCGIFLKIIANQLIVMRILAALLCAGILYLLYQLLRLLKVKREIAVFFLALIGYLLKDLFCIDYNFATLLIVLAIILMEIKSFQKKNTLLAFLGKREILLGMLAGLTITLKQTSGLLICLVLLGNKLLFVKNKEDLKVYLKSFAYRLLGILIPVLCLLLYLLIHHAFDEFISYTITGISSFQNYIAYRNLFQGNLVGLFAILVPLEWLYAWYQCVLKEREKEKYLLFVYGLATFVIVFPISDRIHFLIGAMPSICLVFYEGYQLLDRKALSLQEKGKKIIRLFGYFACCFIFLFVSYLSIKNIIQYVNSRNEFSNLNAYQLIPINSNQEKGIQEVENYILHSQREIKILDATAVVYMIPINRYHKDYDLLLKGNLGANGEERIIQEIARNTEVTYLILQDQYHQNWQTPLNIIDYVKTHKIKRGEIDVFDVYE